MIHSTDSPSYCLDQQNQCLLFGTKEIALRPKTFALLQFLVESGDRLVAKEDLLDAVWAETAVGEEVLKGCIRELRSALGDDPKNPRFIRTYPRRGYRFIGAVAVKEMAQDVTLRPSFTPLSVNIFGREEEISQLDACLAKALDGERQIVFVTGDSGIGKTALVEGFLQRASKDSEILIAYGQCQELYGKGEAYMPVLEALERVGREAGTERLIPQLNRHAPTWLVQMSSLVGEQEQEALQRRVANATPGRMLREIAMALEALTAEIPLIMVLEDLHWSDYSTVDFISSLARRREKARLLLICTYRPIPVNTQGHPLKTVHQNLRVHRQCVDLPLTGLDRSALEDYLGMRLEKGVSSSHLVELLSRLTDGNPLFLLTMVDDLLSNGHLVEVEGCWQLNQDAEMIAVGDSLQQMIQEKLETLSAEDQQLLEAASVAGMDFSAAVIASAIEEDPVAVEQRYADLVYRHQFLRASEEIVGGEARTRYAFNHALHQNVLYQRLTVARRVQLHRRIGEALEASYADRGEVTVALATHFERGRTHRKAVEYHVLAAQKAISRSAYREAVDHLNRGLDFMKLLPDTDPCRRQELRLQIALGNALSATRGYGVEEVGQSFTRAYELSLQLGQSDKELGPLWGLALFRVTRAELQEASQLGKECLGRGVEQESAALRALGHNILGMALLYMGQPQPAREHLEEGLALGDSRRGKDLGEVLVHCRSLLGLVLWILGYPDQALTRCHEAVSMARRIDHPMSRACARHQHGFVRSLRSEVVATRREADALLKIAADHSLPLWSAWGNLLRGWARSVSEPLEAVPQLCQALAGWRTTGAKVMVPTYLGVIAAAFARSGDAKMGLSTISEALEIAEEQGEQVNVSELLRLKGKLLRQDQPEASEHCLRQAVFVAREQGALSWELWATMSLSRVLWERDQAREAREILEEVFQRFSEGFDTADLRTAQALLARMGGRLPAAVLN